MVAVVAVAMEVAEVVEAVVVVVVVVVMEVEYPLTLLHQICQMIIQCIPEGCWSSLFMYLVCHI